jgi:hypothetical protein
MKNFLHIDPLLHDSGLAYVPRYAVEHKNIDIGFEFVGVDSGVNCFLPKFDRYVVGDELASARVFQKGLTDFGARVDGAKDVAARAMEKTRDRAERFSLRAFAAPRRAKEKVSVIFHGKHSLYSKRPGLAYIQIHPG